MTTKQCSGCLLEKPIEQFQRTYNGPDNRRSKCRVCLYQTAKARGPRKSSEQAKANGRARVLAWQKTAAGKATLRNRYLKAQYGISSEEYEALLKSQNGLCAICGGTEPTKWKGKPRPLAVDHDHNVGHVRQLLCSFCNKALGLFKDNAQLLRTAANYLDRHALPVSLKPEQQ